ncbi:hypothetical protein AAIA72_11070 [Hahella sp. SMD15-11]|uniref:Uncharacterized protein n=1 Tax=Thermohahella caldifontis TaxID=3142973 RepID=A0AB39UTG5_9GAMM
MTETSADGRQPNVTVILLLHFAIITSVIALAWVDFYDLKVMMFIDDGIKQSLVALGSAKVLNGIVGMLESSQISFSFGAGGSLDVGNPSST